MGQAREFKTKWINTREQYYFERMKVSVRTARAFSRNLWKLSKCD